MKEKGFTLIELLAVIVILAIIALIATPIVLNIIKDSKKESQKRSAENYLSAVEQAIVRKNLRGKFEPTKCTMTKNNGICEGKFDSMYCEGKTVCEVASLEINIDGELPTEATIIFENNLITDETTITIGDSIFIRENNKFKIEKKEVNHLAKKNVQAVTEATKTTGIVPTLDENGNIKPGSEFKIKVSDNIKNEKGEIAEYTFFVLSNEGEYVNLIAEQNITPDGKFTSEPQNNDEWYITESNGWDNAHGPQIAYTYLSKATNNWTNIPIIVSLYYENEGYKDDPEYGYQSIETKLNQQTGKYITTITPHSLEYGNPVTYENMRTRLPYFSEIKTNTNCIEKQGSCQLWLVNYLTSDETSEQYYNQLNGKESSISNRNFGYWLLPSSAGYSGYVHCIHFWGLENSNYPNKDFIGVRPVITVLKTDLLRVME